MKKSNKLPVVCTIAGSDSGGGAGIQEDLKVFSALGVFGTTVITALTAQNTLGVHGVMAVEPSFVTAQCHAVLSDLKPCSVKTGMLENQSIIEAVADALLPVKSDLFLIVDPVMVAKGGQPLLAQDATETLVKRLLLIADVVTPNTEETEAILGCKIATKTEAIQAAQTIRNLMRTFYEKLENKPEKTPFHAVYLKGGHLPEPEDEAVDILVCEDGVFEFSHLRLASKNTHGTGCTLSAALCAYLAQGFGLKDACEKAKRFVTNAIIASFELGAGISPTNPLFLLQKHEQGKQVLDELEKAWELLSVKPCKKIVAEVQMNMAYCVPQPDGIDDVAGFPGRIGVIGEKLVRFAPPAFGGSSHVARIALTINRLDPNFRTAMNVRFSEEFIERARSIGYSVGEFSRQDEPEDVKIKEGSTLVWGVKKTILEMGFVPDLIFDRGSDGKEPMIRVLGKTPMEIVEKTLAFANLT